jgi:uncharacterized protein (TIGR03067 family)
MMDGNWSPLAAEMGGESLPIETMPATRLIINGNEYTATIGMITDRGSLRVDESVTPNEMDITGADGPNEGLTIPTIYELNGDTLKVCYALDGQERPTEFKTSPDRQLFLVTYKRD